MRRHLPHAWLPAPAGTTVLLAVTQWHSTLGICLMALAAAHPLLTLQSYSFPSGHTAGATVWWGFVLVLCLACLPRLGWRVAAVLVAVLMIAITALSRVYLGVHYLSDVLAAVAEGVAWVALVFTLLSTRPPIARPAAVTEGP